MREVSIAGNSYPENEACVVCRHVMIGARIMLVSLEEDGDIQFQCGSEHQTSEARIIALSEGNFEENGLDQLPKMGPGTQATRNIVNGRWKIASTR